MHEEAAGKNDQEGADEQAQGYRSVTDAESYLPEKSGLCIPRTLVDVHAM